MLEEFLSANPRDAFARYGLALECVKAGDTVAAESHFRNLLTAQPDYLYGYFHYGQLLSRLGRVNEAQETFRTGIEKAQRAHDAKALSELEAALQEVAGG